MKLTQNIGDDTSGKRPYSRCQPDEMPLRLCVQLEVYYHLTDTLVSLIFLITPLGYFIAAYLNSFVHLKLGQRGIASIGPICQLIFAAVASTHPPFPLFLVCCAIGGFGTGLIDGSWCAWTGGMDNANVVSGFLQGSYSVGASLGPLVAGSIISVGHRPWYDWYYVLVSLFL